MLVGQRVWLKAGQHRRGVVRLASEGGKGKVVSSPICAWGRALEANVVPEVNDQNHL